MLGHGCAYPRASHCLVEFLYLWFCIGGVAVDTKNKGVCWQIHWKIHGFAHIDPRINGIFFVAQTDGWIRQDACFGG